MRSSIERGRRSLRWKDNDYAQLGAYYVTLCIQGRQRLLGEIAESAMVLSDAGLMVQRTWQELPAIMPGVELDAFVVMPDHLHAIVVLTTAAETISAPQMGAGESSAQPLRLGDLVARFKTWTMRQYAIGVQQCGWKPFDGRLWQRNYYDHIVRSEDDLTRIRGYIANNVGSWNACVGDWSDL